MVLTINSIFHPLYAVVQHINARQIVETENNKIIFKKQKIM